MPRSPQKLYNKMAVENTKKDTLHNKRLGAQGERKARGFLKRSGYKIVEKNYKCPCGEVDIIAKKGEVLAFVEVKTRLSDVFGTPSQAVTHERQRRYINAARYYFAGRHIDCTVRFDIIEVFRGQINHIENAFYYERNI